MFHRAVAPGIELKLIQMEDAKALWVAVEYDRAYLREWLPWVDHTHSVEDIRAFIETVECQYRDNRGPQSGIWVDGALVGTVGCHPIDHANRNCSIGYWVSSTLQGRGIVTQCCAALLDYLFDEAGLHRVVIQCGTGNAKSCAIPKRLGFTREGINREGEWVSDRWVDLVVWSMLEQDWRKRKHDSRAS